MSFRIVAALVALLALPAPAAQAAETTAEADALLHRFAPVFVQVVGGADGQDRPVAIDFDGDWDTTNNWDHQPRAAASPAAVYGAAVLTETHAYLTYTLYYPRDWTASVCLPYTCHDNDLESVLLVVRRADAALLLVEAKAHNGWRALRAEQLARDPAGRPLLRVEAHGHGIAAFHVAGPAPDARDTVRYAPRAAHAPAGDDAYALLSLHDTLWARRDPGSSRLWAAAPTGPLYYAGSELGRLGRPLGAALAGRRFPGGVRPPWAVKAGGTARGDWFLDPAAVTARRYSLPAGSYVLNPFLEDLRRECVGDDCPHPTPAAEMTRAEMWSAFAGGGVVFVLALWRARRRLAARAGALRSAAHWPRR